MHERMSGRRHNQLWMFKCKKGVAQLLIGQVVNYPIVLYIIFCFAFSHIRIIIIDVFLCTELSI